MDYSNKTNEQLITLLRERDADHLIPIREQLNYLQTRDTLDTDYSIESYFSKGHATFQNLSDTDAEIILEGLNAMPTHIYSNLFRHVLCHRIETEQVEWSIYGDKVTDPS